MKLLEQLKKIVYGSHENGKTQKFGDSGIHNETSFVREDKAHKYAVLIKGNVFNLYFTTPGGVPVTDELCSQDVYHLVDVSPPPSPGQLRTIVRVVQDWLPNVYVSMRIENDSDD